MLAEKAQDVGLLISQRVVNLPPQLLPPLYDALFDEVSWATEDEVDVNPVTMHFMTNFCSLSSSVIFFPFFSFHKCEIYTYLGSCVSRKIT